MKIESANFPVTGMSCASCAVSVESMVASMDGVKSASVNYANQQLHVDYDRDKTNPQALNDAITAIGYGLIIDEDDALGKQEAQQQEEYKRLTFNLIAAFVLAIPVAIIGMFYMHMPFANEIMLVLTAPVLFFFGRKFFINAWKQALHRKVSMDTLVALSTGIAFLFSVFNTFYPGFWLSRGLMPHVYYETAAIIIVFIMLGKLLEERAKLGTSKAIKSLIGLQPKTLRVLRGEAELEIPLKEVMINDVVLVKSGEKIPVDGEVIYGGSYVDESMLSGEPVAVFKQTGDKVYAGTINQKGSFSFRAEKIGEDTVLSQIVKMVRDAQGSKAPIQKLVDKVAGIFVPVVIGIAVLSFLGWMIFGGEDGFTHGLLTMVTVLVIACPCALGLATPTAIMVAVGKGAEIGVLIKDVGSLEIAKKINAVILDKTGTITEGKPQVVETVWFKSEDNFKSYLLSAEERSEHPLAEAIVAHLKAKGVSGIQPTEFESLTGKGVRAVFEGQEYFAGSSRLMQDLQLPVDAIDIKDWKSRGTVIYFAGKNEIISVIAIQDKIKAHSKEGIERLQKEGIEVYMLTGDALETAKSVAEEVGISHYYAEQMPADKANFIKELQAQEKIVAMVGDGINDAHALAQADVSIAMGKGSDIAIETAGITLLSSDLRKISQAVNLSRKAIATINQNLFWAFIYNIIGIPIAAGLLYPINGFLLNPMIAGAAMALSSVSVVLNSLRLKISKI